MLAAKGGVTTACIGAAGRGATINAAGLWKRTRQSAQRPSSTLTAALVTYLCREGSGWKCAMPTVCARSNIAAVIPAILCIQRRRSVNVGCIKSSRYGGPLPGTHQSVGFRRLGQVQPFSVHTCRLIGTIDNAISISISQPGGVFSMSQIIAQWPNNMSSNAANKGRGLAVSSRLAKTHRGVERERL
jgi:hypothetical protein